MSRRRNRAIVERQIELRRKLWPLIEDTDLWLRKERIGFATLPRAVPIILTIMDGMNKGKPVSSTYLDLWCRVMDEMFVQLQSPLAMAFSAGYEGERAVRTWRERMKRLNDDGFIDAKPGAFGEMSYAILLNPYHVIRRHYEAKHPAVTNARYNALMARAHEIGATDLEENLPDDPRTRKPPPVASDLDDEIPF